MKKKINSKSYFSAVEKLQSICVNTYIQTLNVLKTGMSEKEIEKIIISILAKQGILRFWYDIGVMVLIGESRFMDMFSKNYMLKSPSPQVYLQTGNPIFIDFHPVDDDGIWGDYSSMMIFKPGKQDQDKVTFLEQIYKIHIEGIKGIKAHTTGSQVYNWYKQTYKNEHIQLEDPRKNVGHTISIGSKLYKDGSDKRKFLDKNNIREIGESVLAIEPGGYKKRHNGQFLVGRFEDCVYIPNEGKSLILGRKYTLPFFVN